MRPFVLNSRTAALVYLAEREGVDTIFTLDARDFSAYRICLNCKFAGSAQELPSFARLGRWGTCPYVVRGNSGLLYFAGGRRHTFVTSSATAIPSDTSTKR